VGTAKLPRPDEPRKEIAPEPADRDAPPPGPEHQARNSIVMWVAIAILLLAAALCWKLQVAGNLLTFGLMVIALILIMLNVLGLRNPPA
jgi:hypothetical protein